MAFNDGVKSAPIAYIGLVSVIATFVIMMLLQVLFFGEQDEIVTADQASQGTPAALADLTAKQLTVLTRRELVDRDRGIVSIGISRAMDLVVQELAAGRTPAEVAGPPLPAAKPAAKPAAAPVPAGAEPKATEPHRTESKATESRAKQDPTGAPPAAVSPAAEPAPAQEK